ncbi:FMN-dependent NADPH-azoreductase-like [Macrobrachium nipponense]|uniref:FMN-dependent NADPH-azoreductase-like n=1 Tax=Macrobrachium nipponense TaxID=159736 RepID=UPI0030C8B924
MALRMLVFLGSSREGRMGENVAKCVVRMLKEAEQEVELIDPLTVGGDGHVHQPMHFYSDPNNVPEWMVATNAKIAEANAYVIVTPEYNCGLPPALTSILDNFPPASYRHKPCGIVCYSMGSFGGIRAASFARPFLSELGMVSTPSVCVIPQVVGKFTDEGDCTDERIQNNLEKVVKEITWYGKALEEMKSKVGVPS